MDAQPRQQLVADDADAQIGHQTEADATHEVAGERARVGLDAAGHCAYLKPANGFAGQGVVRVDGTDVALAAALTAARRQEPGRHA